MSNSNLSCSATNCVYNNSSNCYASGINVSGSIATNSSATHCLSFEDRSTSNLSNCASGCTCAETNNIICQANNCAHNSDGSCKAPSVQINAQTASCETFIRK
ncbi:DUF1540 domain-containing protein [Romboutsia sp.]|uniref:DUF1540 domain-containing protein n=1 Tax=Romboutsia sp. TaxID=1965302 RepID=UPI002C6BBE9E|nr:DUF1540 domain-containing protein [Romboutsia sp.]HSQ87431.1 DUF1540 domain-containing protein [Romboutsia sp.]